MNSTPAEQENSRSFTYRKGKAKAIATDQGFDDIDPCITYRHLLSRTQGVSDPLRVIALCDCDAFYASCEMVRLGVSEDTPLVVLQWDALIAVNYPARKFGISRMDKLGDAKKRCPELVVVHVATYKEGDTEPGYHEHIDSRTDKVSLDYYRRESMKIITIFKDSLPNGEIEKASIDEAFIDFTRPVREKLFERYPYLATVPHDAPEGIDSLLPPPPPIAWDGLGTLVPITPPPSPPLEGPSGPGGDAGGEVQEEDEKVTTWHDVALSIAAELMNNVRNDVISKLGYSTTAGIARNKFLAKLCASYKKPNNQTILRNAAIPNYLRPMRFQKIRNLGGKLGAALANEYDVSTISDLLPITLGKLLSFTKVDVIEDMQRKFGENAIWVYEILRGIDRSEVREKPTLNKSMLAAKNLQKPITKPSEGPRWIRVLAAELALRLNDLRETNTTIWPKTIVLHTRQRYATSRSKQAIFPFAREVTVDTVASAGYKLWKEFVGSQDTKATPMEVTNVTLGFTGLEMPEIGQQSIEGFFRSEIGQQGPSSPGMKRLREDGDNVQESRSGDIVTRQEVSDSSGYAFVCTRCGKRITLAEETRMRMGQDRERTFAAMRMEHDDFHFAQDLAKMPHDGGSTIVCKGKKRKKESEGIAKFFRPK